jgi:hypothetical protein
LVRELLEVSQGAPQTHAAQYGETLHAGAFFHSRDQRGKSNWPVEVQSSFLLTVSSSPGGCNASSGGTEYGGGTFNSLNPSLHAEILHLRARQQNCSRSIPHLAPRGIIKSINRPPFVLGVLYPAVGRESRRGICRLNLAAISSLNRLDERGLHNAPGHLKLISEQEAHKWL